MRYLPYPEYRNSSIGWFGSVPKRWQIKRLRFATSGIEQGWSPQCDNQAAEENFWGVMKVGCVNGNEFDPQDNKALPQDLKPKPEYELRPGDVLISRANTKELLGSAAIVPNDVRSRLLLCDKLFRLRPEAEVNARFLTYFLRTPTARFQYEREATGASGSMQNIGQDTLRNLLVPLPDASEQKHIAAFLDWKTGQIDALIAKKQALIEKLKEKRLAVITQAMTKGLDSSAPLKNTHIPWLGEVPKHWDIPSLKMRYTVELGKMLDEKKIVGDQLIPYIRNTDVQWDCINFDELPEMDISKEEYQRYTIRENDVLVCEGGEVGRAAIVGKCDEVFGYQKALHRLRAVKRNESPRFIYYTLLWAVGTGVFLVEGASTIAHLTTDQLRRYRFPQPPENEQRAIVDFLDHTVGRLEKMLEKTNTAIARLTEYRTALITAATTGQIDVRNVEIPVQA